MVIQVEDWDAIQATIYNMGRRVLLDDGWEKKFRKRNREIEIESDHCITKDYVLKEPPLLDQLEEELE